MGFFLFGKGRNNYLRGLGLSAKMHGMADTTREERVAWQSM